VSIHKLNKRITTQFDTTQSKHLICGPYYCVTRRVSVLQVSRKILLIIVIAICAITMLWLGRVHVYEFFNTFFILPLGRSYNPVNSAVYAVMLLVGVFLLSRVLSLLKVEVDGKFTISMLPFILLGSCLRVFQDAGIFNSIFLISPLIYLLVFAYTFVCLLLSLLLAKKTGTDYRFLLFFFGAVPATYFAFQLVLQIVNFDSIVLTFSLGAAACLIAFLACLGIQKLVKFEEFTLDVGVVFAQMLDVSSTYVGVTFYGYGEQHFLVRLLTDAFGSSLIFYLLDFLGIMLILLVLERMLRKERQLLGLFRLTLIVLGLAPALRDIFRVALLT